LFIFTRKNFLATDPEIITRLVTDTVKIRTAKQTRFMYTIKISRGWQSTLDTYQQTTGGHWIANQPTLETTNTRRAEKYAQSGTTHEILRTLAAELLEKYRRLYWSLFLAKLPEMVASQYTLVLQVFLSPQS